MGYVESNLMMGERITYQTRLHWIHYCGSVILSLAAILILFVGLQFLDLNILAPLTGILQLIAGFKALSNWVIVKTSEFTVTNRRVVIKTGVIRRRTLELLLAKIETIAVDQTFLGRILDYGTIVVIGTGGTHERFENILRPLQFRLSVHASTLGEHV